MARTKKARAKDAPVPPPPSPPRRSALVASAAVGLLLLGVAAPAMAAEEQNKPLEELIVTGVRGEARSLHAEASLGARGDGERRGGIRRGGRSGAGGGCGGCAERVG